MIKKYFFLIIIYLFFFSKILNAEIQDKILAKIGNEIITNYDIVNEINTILALSNKQSNQEDFKNLQNMAFQSLKKLSIKKIEIERYKIKDYNKNDLDGYLKTIEKNIGLENLMRLRQEAKQGLAQMEAMGQMGNSEEATLPDDIPFDESDLIAEDDDGDEIELAKGGVLKAQEGTVVP